MTLMGLKRAGQAFCRMALGWDFLDVFLLTRLGLCVSGREDHGGKVPFINMIYCGPWSPRWSSECQASLWSSCFSLFHTTSLGRKSLKLTVKECRVTLQFCMLPFAYTHSYKYVCYNHIHETKHEFNCCLQLSSITTWITLASSPCFCKLPLQPWEHWLPPPATLYLDTQLGYICTVLSEWWPHSHRKLLD